jgi:hypothetical protein
MWSCGRYEDLVYMNEWFLPSRTGRFDFDFDLGFCVVVAAATYRSLFIFNNHGADRNFLRHII